MPATQSDVVVGLDLWWRQFCGGENHLCTALVPFFHLSMPSRGHKTKRIVVWTPLGKLWRAGFLFTQCYLHRPCGDDIGM